jgi:diguanylate cyclase (GGDEF)-like protein
MESIFCSNLFRDFWNATYNKALSPAQTLENLSAEILPLTKALGIARIDVEKQSSKTPDEKKATGGSIRIFDKGTATDNPVVSAYGSNESGLTTISVYPAKGNEFSTDALKDIKFLSSIISALLEHSRLTDLIYQATITDAATGVHNPHYLVQMGNMLEGKGLLSKYTAFFINLKNFKYVNKSLGPEPSNRVLTIYAQSAKAFLKEGEVFVRLGGDNFFALIFSERTNDFLNKFVIFPINERKQGSELIVQVMARMGVYRAIEGDTFNELMNKSAVALDLGRNVLNKDITLFKPEMMEKVMYQKKVSTSFPRALNDGEFIIYLQPKINLYDNNMHSAEALVRWVHDDRIIPPAEFVNILEKEESICKLDLYVFESVCKCLRKWLNAGLHVVRISSNFSKRNLRNQNIVNEILSIMKKYDIDSKYIEIELTEISDYDDYMEFEGFVKKLRRNGISVAIDDFGTGYSTMNVLKNLDVDVIKIDKSLIDNLENPKKEDEIVIRNIVNMINELSIDTIAEGVETPAQVKFLKRIHCPLVQGFLFDQPLTISDFEKRLKAPHYYESI